jgi:hypothetical protein
MMLLRRTVIALAIAGAIYGLGLGVGSILYATGAIATGATHNDCEKFREDIARRQGIDEEDVPQRDIKQAAEQCLATHELTAKEAFREEYLLWPAWPAAICAVVFLLWPAWSRILHNQQAPDGLSGEAAPRH